MKFIHSLVLVFAVAWLGAQNLSRSPQLRLPKDSAESRVLLEALKGFLLAAQEENTSNAWVYEKEKTETFILLDELKGIEKHAAYKEDHFYRACLNNVVALKDSTYLLQIAYQGQHADTLLLRASFCLLAHKSGSGFSFSSLLARRSSDWKSIKAGNSVLHYKNSITTKKVKEFAKVANAYDQKLKCGHIRAEYYGCRDIFEAMYLLGIDYKSDYSGRQQGFFSASCGNQRLVLLGNNKSQFDSFDPHDLWHDRMSLVLPRSKANRAVDEGCAYLYGGSWGLSWKEIYKAFKEQVASNKNTNWTEVKEQPLYFKTQDFSNSADYIVNALLVKKIEHEKGFAGVWELLCTGPAEKGNENYYLCLEKLIGIGKANYNEKVWELINQEK